MKIAEFFVGLFFDADKKAVDEFSGSVDELGKTIKQLKVVAAVAAIERLVNASVQGTAALMSFNSQTGISIDRLQQFQAAANQANVGLSFDEVSQSILTVQKNLAQIRMGQGDIAPFQLLGIDVVGKDAVQVIEQVREAIKGLDSATATNLIQQIGLSPEFMKILQLSRQEFEAMANSDNFLSEEQRKKVERLGRSMNSFRVELGNLKDQAAAAFEPVFSRIFRLLENINVALIRMVEAIGESKIALGGLVIIAGRLAIAFFPVTAAITALLLVLEDLAVWMMGGDSMIGEAIKGFKKLGAEIKDAFDFELPGSEMFSSFGIAKGLQGALNSDFVQGAASSVTTSFRNIFNINSSADAGAVANKVVTEQQRQLNYSLQDVTSGARN